MAEYRTTQQFIGLVKSLEVVLGCLGVSVLARETERLPDCWISVKDRLPPENGGYLCYEKGHITNSVEIRGFTKNLEKADRYEFEGVRRAGWYDYDSEVGVYEVHSVTHWMPLPEPPKEE